MNDFVQLKDVCKAHARLKLKQNGALCKLDGNSRLRFDPAHNDGRVRVRQETIKASDVGSHAHGENEANKKEAAGPARRKRQMEGWRNPLR